MSTACIVDDIVYIAELAGYVQCLDAKTGKKYWQWDTKSNIWGSCYYVDGKVLVANEDGDLYFFKHDKYPEVIDEIAIGSAAAIEAEEKAKADGSNPDDARKSQGRLRQGRGCGPPTRRREVSTSEGRDRRTDHQHAKYGGGYAVRGHGPGAVCRFGQMNDRSEASFFHALQAARILEESRLLLAPSAVVHYSDGRGASTAQARHLECRKMSPNVAAEKDSIVTFL